jgi:streptogramin lyase
MSYTITSIGTSASPAFFSPYGVALDTNNNIYVTNAGNNIIQKISSLDGSVTNVSTSISLTSPRFITVDNSGNIYLLGQGSTSVYLYKIDSSGTVTDLSNTIGLVLTDLSALAINTANTHLYVAGGTNNETIYQLNISGSSPSVIQSWNISVSFQILGIAVDSTESNLYLTSLTDTIAIYKLNISSGTFSPITIPVPLSSPSGISFTNTGFLVITNSSFGGGIFRITTTGQNVPITTTNPQEFSFNGTTDVTCDSVGNLYVASSGNNSVYKLIYNNIVCFKEDTKILTDSGYKLVQDLRKGDLVKTLLNGFVPIEMIAKKDFYNPASSDRIKDQLYILTNENYPDVFEPLVITGCHCILVDEFKDDEQRNQVNEVLGKIYATDGKYRLPACVDERCEIYEKKGNCTIYHIALENEDYYGNYGIYANGLLVETCSLRYLKEYSTMTLLE